MNKQEKNIVNILTFDETENIVDVFANKLLHTDKTVALITNRELVEYAMDYFISNDCVAVKKVDLELDNENSEYMISVDDDGYMVVQPVEYYDDKYFNDIEYAFVDMDGCVDQMTIDNLLDRNVEIVLFGYEDCEDSEEEGFTVNGKPVSKEEFDNYVSQFKHDEKPTTTSKSEYFINGKSVDKSEFDKKYEEFEEKYMDNIRDMMLNYCTLMDEMDDWRSRMFRW